MQLEIGILQDICDQIANEIDAVVTIFGGRGRVIASSKRSRIGDLHENAAKIMVGEIDFQCDRRRSGAIDQHARRVRRRYRF